MDKEEDCDDCCAQPCLCPLRVAKPKPKFRFIRVLEYVGEKEWIKSCVVSRAIKGKRIMGTGEIRELNPIMIEEVNPK